MDDRDPATVLAEDRRWKWVPGMLDDRGERVLTGEPRPGAKPELSDWATAGAILGLLAERGALTDVVRDTDGWIVAVDLSADLQGYAADTLGEAAAWALMAVWDEEDVRSEVPEA